MSKKLSLAVLLSGNGTNFQAIIDSIENGRLKAAIKIVISNNKDAFGLNRAKKHNIKNSVKLKQPIKGQSHPLRICLNNRQTNQFIFCHLISIT